MSASPPSPKAPDQRKSRRIKVFMPAEIVVEDTAMRAHVLDISASGSRVHTGGTARAGDQASLQLDGNAFSARVIWTAPDRCGIAFSTELTPEQVARFVPDRQG